MRGVADVAGRGHGKQDFLGFIRDRQIIDEGGEGLLINAVLAAGQSLELLVGFFKLDIISVVKDWVTFVWL